MRIISIPAAALAAAVIGVPVASGLAAMALAPSTVAKPAFYRPGQPIAFDLRFAGQTFRVEAVVDEVVDRLEVKDACDCGHDEPPALSLR